MLFFSAAVQLMFHSFSTGMKKQLLLYGVMTTSGDIDVIGKVLDVSEMLYQGKNISYDAKTLMRLATQATVDKNGIRDKYGCKKGQENYLDAIDSVLWLCNTIFKPEANIMMTYVTVETGLNEVKDHNSFVVMPNGCRRSCRTSFLQIYVEKLNLISVRKFTWKLHPSLKQLLKENSRLLDSFFVSWTDKNNTNVKYEIIRGYIYYAKSHYITYVKSYKGSQDRQICYDDNEVCLNAKEAMFLAGSGRVYGIYL